MSRNAGKKIPPDDGTRQSVLDIFLTVFKYVLIILLIMFLVSVCRQAYSRGYSVFSDTALDAKGEGKSVQVTITEGMTTQQIGDLLVQDGLIVDADTFVIQERLSSDHGKITPGTYTISSDMTPLEIIAELSKNYTEASGDADTKDSNS